MATAATRLEKNFVQRKNKRIDLTPTGLLMEGDYTNYRSQLVNSGSSKTSADGWGTRLGDQDGGVRGPEAVVNVQEAKLLHALVEEQSRE
jgi:hypothetical protein